MSNSDFERGYEEGYKVGFDAGQKIAHEVLQPSVQKLPLEFSNGHTEATQEFIDQYELADEVEVGDVVKVIRDMNGNIIGILNTQGE